MSGFQTQTASAVTTAPDPHKHVNYSLGMVLGVDDFDQEFAYLSNRDQWLARDTLGYGTVCGLQIKIQTDERGPRVEVEPGVAINPRGQLIRVTPAQCAYLNDWLTAQRDAVLRQVGSPLAGQVTLYVVLCYRDCPTDPVPIPGEPCRDETEATAASRCQDDFELKLALSAPDQVEEDAVRDFVAWLRPVEISDSATSVPLADFLSAIRNATYWLQSPPASPPNSPPDFMYGSPPGGLAINSADACEYLRAALRLWVTELRPLWRGAACDGSAPAENCVLLAELEVPLVDGQASSTDSVVVHEERRPYLVHLRLLQEWLTCGPRAAGGATLSPATTVVTEESWDLPDSVGTATHQFALADHTHGTPTDPIPPHQVDADAHTLAGDVTGQIGSTTVEQIQHVLVDPNPPTLDGQVLTYDAVAKQWTPRAPAGGTAAGAFVEHPAKLDRYFIVAAGIAQADGSDPTPQWSPDYNHLLVKVFGPSRLLVHFDNYQKPEGKHQYVIKAMPVFDEKAWANAKVRQPVVSFEGYTGDGILLHVTDLGNTIEPGPLSLLSFVIEVSQYPELPG